MHTISLKMKVMNLGWIKQVLLYLRNCYGAHQDNLTAHGFKSVLWSIRMAQKRHTIFGDLLPQKKGPSGEK